MHAVSYGTCGRAIEYQQLLRNPRGAYQISGNYRVHMDEIVDVADERQHERAPFCGTLDLSDMRLGERLESQRRAVNKTIRGQSVPSVRVACQDCCTSTNKTNESRGVCCTACHTADNWRFDARLIAPEKRTPRTSFAGRVTGCAQPYGQSVCMVSREERQQILPRSTRIGQTKYGESKRFFELANR